MALLRFLILGAVILCASSESLDARLGAIESKVKSLEAIHANKEVKAAVDWQAIVKEACAKGAPAMCNEVATFAETIPKSWHESLRVRDGRSARLERSSAAVSCSIMRCRAFSLLHD